MTESTEAVVEPAEVAEVSAEDAAREIWNRSEENQPRDERGRFAVADEKPADAAVETPETPVQAEPANDAPSHLPRAIREVWGTLDEGTRTVISDTQREYAKRLQEAEQIKRAAGPVYDRLVQAAKDMPGLADKTPDQIAAEVFELSQWANRLQADPVEAIMAIANHRNVADQLKARFAGGEQPAAPDPMAAVMQELAALKAQIAGRPDPAAIETQVAQQMEAARMQGEVEAFAQSKPDWGILEPHIQNRLPQVMEENPHLKGIELLDHAYNTVATELLNPLRSAAVADTARANKAEAAKAAASINVQAEGAGEPAPLSDREAALAIWQRDHA